jgi:hypothetical protein
MMHLLFFTAWIAGGVLMFLALPWLVFGVLCFYFKILRRGRERTWIDLPAAHLLYISVMLINVTTVLVTTAVEKVTGIEILRSPPHPRRPPRSR